MSSPVEDLKDDPWRRHDGYADRLDGLSTRVDGLTTRVDGLATTIARIEGRLEEDRLERRVPESAP